MNKLKWWIIKLLLSETERVNIQEMMELGIQWKQQEAATGCGYYAAQNEEDDIRIAHSTLRSISKDGDENWCNDVEKYYSTQHYLK
jgi:hypothetical protein